MSWRLIAVLSLMGCIVIEILFNILPIDHNTLLLYWFYPASLMALTQLYFSLRITKHWEIRFLLIYLGWMCLVVVLNHSRAHFVESYQWFACACTTLFLCFSLPYAFSKETAYRAMTALAIATVLAVSLLSIVCVIAIYAPNFAAKFPSIFEGFSFWEGRFYIDNHPNRSAPAQALAVILVGYLLAQSKKSWQKVLWVLLGILCFFPLALTVSRTGIIGAGFALGFEVYLALQETLRKRTRVVLRVLIGVAAAMVTLVVVYKGASLVSQVNNAYLARVEAAQTQQDVPAIAPPAEPESTPTEGQEAPPVASQPAESVIASTEIGSRGLSDADSFNGRTDIWLGVFKGLLQNPKILAFGTGPVPASKVMSPYFPVDSPIGYFHNSLLAELVSFGVIGLLFTVALLVLIAVSAIRLSFGARQKTAPLAMRMLPAILLFTVAEGMMEDFLFAYQSLSISWIWLMVAAGFVVSAVKKEPLAQQQTIEK
ncbi:MAG: O-antigen ligase family protein [Eubacteriales bacterium]|nr:O-antigen ligase family protein [Eubacteriales bacterium]